MKKITLIHNGWLSAKNGANTVMNLLLNNELFFNNHGITIARCSLDDITARSFDGNDSKCLKYRFRSKCRSLLTKLSTFSAFFTRILLLNTEFKVARRVVDYYMRSTPSENDVAFFHALIPCYFYLKKRINKQQTVLVLHTNGDNFKMDRIYYPKLKSSKYYKTLLKIEEYVLDNVDRISFVSETSRHIFLSLHPNINPNKVFYIHNGVENKPKISHKTLNSTIEICCVASISERKGQRFIIDAVKSLISEGRMPNIHFTFVGDGPDRTVLQEIVKKENLQNLISFVGITNDVDIYLKQSDIYILPSEDEGLPMAILEAMRGSLPIVSTPVGGIPEVLKEGYNGILIQPSSESVIDFINKINDYNWIEMGQNSRKLFEERFTVENMIEGYVRLLNFE